MNFKNLYPYLKERFPVVNMALFAILFFTVYSVAIFFNPYTTNIITMLGGVMATIFFFFRLRVFDEIKDYQIDIVNHPHRVLQSGHITLSVLKVLALLGAVVEIVWSFSMGTLCVLGWFAAFLFSLLMRYDFFIPNFLRKRLVLYAITHMVIMPLVILWIWLAFNHELSSGYVFLALLSLTGGFSFEIARKIHSKDAERPTVDSYSRSIGLNGAVLTVLLLLICGMLILFRLISLMDASFIVYVLVVTLFLGTLIMYGLAIKSGLEKKFRNAEILVSLFMLISYLAVIIEINF